MKIIFLDFDGVLNSMEWMKGRPDLGEDCNHFDPRAVARLNRLISATDAVVVISSSWRILIPEVEKIDELLRSVGFAGSVIDKTPDLPSRTTDGRRVERGDEIKTWLEMHRTLLDVEKFIVLDDSSDMTAVMARFVQTNHDVGLTDADVDRAIEMLR